MTHHAFTGLAGLTGLSFLGHLTQGQQTQHRNYDEATLRQSAIKVLAKELEVLTHNQTLLLGDLLRVPRSAYTPDMLLHYNGQPMSTRPEIFQKIISLWLSHRPDVSWHEIVVNLVKTDQLLYRLAYFIWKKYIHLNSSHICEGKNHIKINYSYKSYQVSCYG